MSSSTQLLDDEGFRERLISIVRRAHVLDREANLIRLNNLWFEPDIRRDFSKVMVDFLASLPHLSADSVLLYPEGLLSSFSILPIVSLVANELGCRMVVWREIGDIVTTTPRIFPESATLPRDLTCVVLQDVVSRGTTLRKMYELIREIGWTIVYYIAVVKIEGGEDDIQENIRECQPVLSQHFQFKHMISDSDVRRA